MGDRGRKEAGNSASGGFSQGKKKNATTNNKASLLGGASRQGAGQNGLPLLPLPVSSSACLFCGHCCLSLPLPCVLLPSRSEPKPSSLFALSPHPTPSLGSPTAEAQVPTSLGLGGSLRAEGPLSALPPPVPCPPCPQSPAEGPGSCPPWRGGGTAEPDSPPPAPLLGQSPFGESVQFPLRPLGAARQLCLVPPLKGPGTWQVFSP